MVTRTGNALPRVQHAQLGKGREVYGFNLETVSWGQILQRAKCSHNLLSSVALSNQRVLTWSDTLPLWKTPLCSLLKSLNFLGTACVLRWPRRMRRDVDLAGATEQYQRQYPFRKGKSKPGWFNAREEMPALPRCSTTPNLFSSTLPPCGSQVEIQTDAHVQEGGTSCRSFGCSIVQSYWQQMHMCLRKCLVPESIQLLMIGEWHLLRPKHWLRAWKVQLAREGVCLFANRESYAKALTLGTDLCLLARPNLHVCPLWDAQHIGKQGFSGQFANQEPVWMVSLSVSRFHCGTLW